MAKIHGLIATDERGGLIVDSYGNVLLFKDKESALHIRGANSAVKFYRVITAAKPPSQQQMFRAAQIHRYIQRHDPFLYQKMKKGQISMTGAKKVIDDRLKEERRKESK